MLEQVGRGLVKQVNSYPLPWARASIWSEELEVVGMGLVSWKRGTDLSL